MCAIVRRPDPFLTHPDLAKAAWPGAKERLPLTTVRFNGRRNENAKACLQDPQGARSGSVECCANLIIGGSLIMVTQTS